MLHNVAPYLDGWMEAENINHIFQIVKRVVQLTFQSPVCVSFTRTGTLTSSNKNYSSRSDFQGCAFKTNVSEYSSLILLVALIQNCYLVNLKA